MSLEAKSQELKGLVSTYDTRWFIGDLSNLMRAIPRDGAQDQLGSLSSPLRQLYFLGGLLLSTDDTNGIERNYTPEKWNEIVRLLNEIEKEYDLLFFPKTDEQVNEEWRKIREVAIPSFLSYFNQGPLNYEEQIINWVRDLYTQLDKTVENETGLLTEHFILFYENIDTFIQKKFRGFTHKAGDFNEEWLSYTDLQVEARDGVPDFIEKVFEENKRLYAMMADHGLIYRFKPSDLVSEGLSLDQATQILSLLSCNREESDFLYYTSTNPGNPLYTKPIVDIEGGLYQVFEIKQVIHAIDNYLEKICSRSSKEKTSLVEKKGKLLEDHILVLFEKFFKKDYTVFRSYYVDGCEQDILFLWKKYAFIIEAKGYNLREPFRDPNRAFVRIKDDFKACIGYGYAQTKRVEQKFVDQVPLRIEDKNGNLIEEIDTTKYEDNDFSIIVNLKSFGQIQNDLSTLLEIEEDDAFPWVVKYEDLEVFLLTLTAKKKRPEFFIDYLLLREDLHGKLICSDELEICGGYLTGNISKSLLKKRETIATTNELTKVFDEQYIRGMGFKNEKYIKEKRSGKNIFL